MNISEQGGRPAQTATIYQFPVGGRAARNPVRLIDAIEEEALRAPHVDFGSWYHQEAVEAAAGGDTPVGKG